MADVGWMGRIFFFVEIRRKNCPAVDFARVGQFCWLTVSELLGKLAVPGRCEPFVGRCLILLRETGNKPHKASDLRLAFLHVS